MPTPITSPSSASRRHLELVGDAGRGQRVVATGAEALRQAGEDPAAVVLDLRCLPVQQPLRLGDLAAEGLDDRLVARGRRRASASWARGARTMSSVAPDSSGLPGPGETTRWVGASSAAPAASTSSFRRTTTSAAELLQQVREVVRERVVVVDQQHLHRAASARLRAVSSAASLRRHSSCSAWGLESATMPAPACMCATPSWRTIVRMAMHVSSEPSGRR